MPVIRLLAPILVAHDQFPPGAVFDASDEVADMLIEGKDGVPCAEITFTAERYPLGQPLVAVTAFPVFPGDRFPLPKEPDGEVAARSPDREEAKDAAGDQLPGGAPRPRLVPGMFTTETDRRIAARVAAAGSTPVGVETRREVAPARIDQSTVQQDDALQPQDAYDANWGAFGHHDAQGNWVQSAKQPTTPAPAPPTPAPAPPTPAPAPPKPAPKPAPAPKGKGQDNPDDDE